MELKAKEHYFGMLQCLFCVYGGRGAVESFSIPESRIGYKLTHSYRH